jgi:hypothetical protein
MYPTNERSAPHETIEGNVQKQTSGVNPSRHDSSFECHRDQDRVRRDHIFKLPLDVHSKDSHMKPMQ